MWKYAQIATHSLQVSRSLSIQLGASSGSVANTAKSASSGGKSELGPVCAWAFFIGMAKFPMKLIRLAVMAPLAVDKNVGGQAVIEGVMIKSPERVSTSVRLPNGRIVTRTEEFVSLARRYKILKKPILRGILSFFEMLVLGIRTLNYSAEMATADPQITDVEAKNHKSKGTNLALAGAVAVSIGAGLLIFFFLPILITQLISIEKQAVGFNIVAGLIRMAIFLAYVWTLSRFREFRRLFEYHGAEHKSIFAFEADLPLEIKSTHEFKTHHPRCGTSFILIVALLAILTYSVSDSLFAVVFGHGPGIFERFATHMVFLPLVAGLSFELLKLSGRTRNNLLTRTLIAPGLWIQHITTREPSDDQIEVAMTALKSSISGTALDPSHA